MTTDIIITNEFFPEAITYIIGKTDYKKKIQSSRIQFPSLKKSIFAPKG